MAEPLADRVMRSIDQAAELCHASCPTRPQPSNGSRERLKAARSNTEDGKGEPPNQIHSYVTTNFKELLPKGDEALLANGKDRWCMPDPAGDLEKLCERSLLKEIDPAKGA